MATFHRTIPTFLYDDTLDAAARLANLHSNRFVLLTCSLYTNHLAQMSAFYLHVFIDNLHVRQSVNGSGGLAVTRHIHEPHHYIGIHRKLQGINESQKQVCDKCGSMIHIHTHNYYQHVINVGLAQACPIITCILVNYCGQGKNK